MKNYVDVNEKLPFKRSLPLSFQHMFAMFGSSVLVPILFGINPGIVLLFNGIATLLYIVITKKKIPAYLGSSFAFIAPVTLLINKHFDFASIQSGFIAAGLLFTCISLIIRFTGIGWLKTLFPPASMGAIVAVIGLQLAPTAADMAGFPVGLNTKILDPKLVAVSMVTLLAVILSSVLLKGFLKVIPILIGIVVGYVFAFFTIGINMHPIGQAAWIAPPALTIVKFNMTAILTILPATFVIVVEHIGHLVVTGSIVGKDLTEDPGLHRSMLGDGLSTMISGFFGSVPTTTYGENIGVLAITKVYSVWVIGGAAVISIILAFSGKLSALIRSIPTPVIGGVSLILFGTIAASGLRTLIEEKVDFSNSRNLLLTSVIMIVGLSGISINIGSVLQVNGMTLATLVAIVLNLIFIIFDKLKLTNE